MSAQKELDRYYDMVEEVITELGTRAEQCRTLDTHGEVIPGQWNLAKGSAKILADVYTTAEGLSYFCVAAPVMMITASDPNKLYEKLLKLNHQMYSASFSINQGWVWLRILRECEGMDKKECRSTFDRVGWYADQYDDMLKNEFGGSVT
ncbi:YbjN domain-containing protein [bacterium]|nr:MAG: YbjN domain-containing protein [bacterium]